MTKKRVRTIALGMLSLIALYPATWIASGYGLLGELPFGYYRDFYLIKHTIKSAPCIKNSSYSRHEDITLEDFHFTLYTDSGRLVRLWFEAQEDIDRICSSPEGVLVVVPREWNHKQLYRIESIRDYLWQKSSKVVTLEDVLCSLEKLAPLFEGNYTSEVIPVISWQEQFSTKRYRGYITLELDKEENSGGWVETKTE